MATIRLTMAQALVRFLAAQPRTYETHPTVHHTHHQPGHRSHLQTHPWVSPMCPVQSVTYVGGLYPPNPDQGALPLGTPPKAGPLEPIPLA